MKQNAQFFRFIKWKIHALQLAIDACIWDYSFFVIFSANEFIRFVSLFRVVWCAMRNGSFHLLSPRGREKKRRTESVSTKHFSHFRSNKRCFTRRLYLFTCFAVHIAMHSSTHLSWTSNFNEYLLFLFCLVCLLFIFIYKYKKMAKTKMSEKKMKDC